MSDDVGITNMSDDDSNKDLSIDITNDDENYDPENLYIPFPSTSSQKRANPTEEIYDELLSDDSEKNNLDNEATEEAYDSSDGTDSESVDICAICLGHIKGKIGSPDTLGCEHFFCLLCILEWAKNNPVCPQDRRPFERVLVRNDVTGKVISNIATIKAAPKEENLEFENPTYCEVCGSSEREDCLLLCDGCDLGYHLDCLTPPLSEVPIEEWFCPLCVAAGLPEVVNQRSTAPPQAETTVEKKQLPAKRRKNDKTKSHSKTRMIPRTRATERVLQRISQTRKKERRRREKKEKKSAAVQAFKKAKPFGSIADDDIDAAFNYDAYADKLLDSSSLQSKHDKKRTAYEKLHTFECSPSPSYCGRALHPKVNKSSQSSEAPDILSNILEDQFVLLSSSKNISLTEERKLTKINGEKKEDFNIDRENKIMSEPLPSQRNAKLANDKKEMKSDDFEKQSFCKNESNSCSDKIGEFSNGRKESKHDSSSLKSPSSESKSYANSSSSSKSDPSKSHSSYHQSFRRRSRERHEDREYHSRRRKDSRRRERSKSRERSSRNYGHSREKYEVRCHKSQSRSRRRSDECRWRRSKTPERHSTDRKLSHRKSSNSFWGSSYTEPFKKDANSFTEKDQSTHNVSVHSMNISHLDKQSNIFEASGKKSLSRVSETKYDNNDKSENIASPLTGKDSFNLESASKLVKDSKVHLNMDVTSIADMKLNETHSEYKGCDTVSDSLKRDIQYSNVAQEKLRKLKNLFGEDNDESESPPTTELDVSVLEKELPSKSLLSLAGDEGYSPNYSLCDRRKANEIKVKPELSQKFIDQLESDNEEVYSPRSFLPSNMDSPEEPPIKKSRESPTLGIEDLTLPEVKAFVPASPISDSHSLSSDEELEDITTLSKTSRDLILNSLFGKYRVQDTEKVASESSGNVDQNAPKAAQIVSERSSLKKTKTETRNMERECIDNILEKKVVKDSNKTTVPKNKIKLFDNLFGNSSSDTEMSDGELQDSSPSKISDQFLNKITISESLKNALKEDTKRKVEAPKIEFGPKEKETLLITKEDQEEVNQAEQSKLNEGSQTATLLKSATPVSKVKANKLALETKVVEEAKRFLNPYYLEKGLSKQMYKEIISKCVNKVLEVECGHTVEPKKIKKLVDGYVHLYQHRRKKKGSSEQFL